MDESGLIYYKNCVLSVVLQGYGDSEVLLQAN